MIDPAGSWEVLSAGIQETFFTTNENDMVRQCLMTAIFDVVIPK